MTPSERMYEISDAIADAALAALRKARIDAKAGKMSAPDFNVATREFSETMNYATQITAMGVHTAASQLLELTQALKTATTSLNEAIVKIKHSSDSLKIIGGVLAFAAAIVAAAAAPALLPGAVAAGLSLATIIHDVSASEDPPA